MATPSQQIHFSMPQPVLEGIDQYIQQGDLWDMDVDPIIQKNYPDAPRLDITRASLVKFLMSGYSNKQTEVADNIHARISEDSPKTKHITIRSSHPSILTRPDLRKYRLICAMVYMGIPIPNYFDGKKEINV